jgi:hypothetical protein
LAEGNPLKIGWSKKASMRRFPGVVMKEVREGTTHADSWGGGLRERWDEGIPGMP